MGVNYVAATALFFMGYAAASVMTSDGSWLNPWLAVLTVAALVATAQRNRI